jgi:hypothetical protein
MKYNMQCYPRIYFYRIPKGQYKKTIQRNWQHRAHKPHDKYMLENTEGAKKKEQSRETGNIVYTRHRTNM